MNKEQESTFDSQILRAYARTNKSQVLRRVAVENKISFISGLLRIPTDQVIKVLLEHKIICYRKDLPPTSSQTPRPNR
jgi:hypothetical protein